MKTTVEEIVDLNSIGLPSNPKNLSDILKKANEENLPSSKMDKEKVLLLVIDMQLDFMENGSLGVKGSHEDVKNLISWIYENVEKITKIAFSIDTHQPFQIFFPCWWVDGNYNNPAPFTTISLEDLDNNKWKPVINPPSSRRYVKNLEKMGKKKLVIWSYHCIQGTTGHCLENQLGNIIYFHSVAKKRPAIRMVKGTDPMTEMYGILKAEYDPNNRVNLEFLNEIPKYDKIIIAGEAKSHCVLESVKQILEYYEDDPKVTEKIYILEDCMSSIKGYEKDTEEAFKEFQEKYNINITNSKQLKL